MPKGFADDYIMVNERIIKFIEKYPDGSLQSELVELTDKRVIMRGMAFRAPDDERPGVGFSWLEIPGKTAFTRGSEIENCETSAWGRALAALGFEVKRGIASAEEIANKQAEGEIEVEVESSAVPGVEKGGRTRKVNALQITRIRELSQALDLGAKGLRDAIERILNEPLVLPDDQNEAAVILVDYLDSLSREDISTLIQGLAAEVEALNDKQGPVAVEAEAEA